MTKRTASNKSSKRATATAAETATGGPKLHTPEAQLFDMSNDSPRISWMNRFFGFISTFAVAAGIGFVAELAINAMVSAVMWATGSVLAALAVYYLGIVMMIVAIMLVTPLVYDAVATGQTTLLLKSGWGWLMSKVRRTDDDEEIPPKANGAAGQPSFAH